jgi:hypothetical protein
LPAPVPTSSSARTTRHTWPWNGHGRQHDATLAAYQEAARKNLVQDKFGKAHVEVISFDAVTNPEEIALDLITLVS